jgi:hypothetical protein
MNEKYRSSSSRRVTPWLLWTGIILITGAVATASKFAWHESHAWTTGIDILLVLSATTELDIIFWKLITASPSGGLDSSHPRWHFASTFTTFVMTIASALYLGLTYFHVTPVVNSAALATLVIAGSTLPAGTSLILAAAAWPKVPEVEPGLVRKMHKSEGDTED